MPIGLIFANDDIVIDNKTAKLLSQIHNIDIDILQNVNHNAPFFIEEFSNAIIKMINKLDNPSIIKKENVNFNYDHIDRFYGSFNVYDTDETIKLLHDYIKHVTN
jgi:hypothetical protein